MSGYTVIDVETTGLSPERHDRVVEVGVVYVSEYGDIQDSWSTLVNPGRDVGPTRIHGIRASDIVGAPTFDQLAPYLLRAVAGRTLVAHNAPFDLRFVAHEMQRAGIPLSRLPLTGVCTMQWSTAFLNAPSRRLVDCCAASGIELSQAHSAEADALATAGLLRTYLTSCRHQPPWGDVLTTSAAYPWPTYNGTYPEMAMHRRSESPVTHHEDWLETIVARMPRAADAAADSYLAVLELALVDGFLAEHEKDALIDAAAASGLNRSQVLSIHREYLEAMASVALADHVVTPAERREMERVAAMLGLHDVEVERALTVAAGTRADQRPRTPLTTAGITLSPGDRVVFTGDMATDRDAWFQRCRAQGLDPGGVTKKTRVVVASDPNSLSGKAAKARGYGIPVITEAAFEGLIRRMEDNNK